MDRQKETIELLRQMVGIPSVSGQERRLAYFIKEYMEDMGAEVRVTDLTDTQSNLIAEIRFGDDPVRIMTGGHIDTVPPAKGWKTDPFRMVCEGDRAYGLGVCDMKAGLAAQLTVLRQMIEEGTPFRGTVIFTGAADEEAFSAGANRMTEEGLRADFAILGEPNFYDIVTSANGKGLITLQVLGKGGHAASPETGVNAVYGMALLLERLEADYRERYERGECGAYCPLRVWSEYPGYSLNIPDCCQALVNKQLAAGETIEEFIYRAEHIFKETGFPGELRVIREKLWYPSYALDRNETRTAEFFEFLKKEGHPYREVNGDSVSDANLFVSKCGIPTVLFGPEGANLHAAGEYTVLSSIEKYRNYLINYFRMLGERTGG